MFSISSNKPRFLFSMPDVSIDVSVAGMWVHETLSELFTARLNLVSSSEITSFTDIIGSEALLTIVNNASSPGSDDRYIHGIVRKFEYSGNNGKYLLYDAEIVPSVWQLNLRKNCRIFQEINVQDIVETLLDEGGLSSDDYRFDLVNEERKRGFCVQYRETDIDFITRLLEEEGIYYFFEHYEDKHVLVISDNKIAHCPINGDPSIPYNPGGGMVAAKESIHAFSFSERLRPGAFIHTNYNFKKPGLDLASKQTGENPESYEIYDCSAPYVMPDRGEALSEARMEELVALQKQGSGHSTSCRLVPGYTFNLTNHMSGSLNAEYLVVEVTHSGEQPQVLGEQAEGKSSYRNKFKVIPSSVQFRPRITIEKPFVRGLQSARVVGLDGEEIYTDEYGRIKIQFHWDREGKNNDKSSCWLRTNQPWSGNGWGMVSLPRIGDEVLVDFIEGDPDRPIMMGNVNNAASPALYDLPANKTQSGIKTRSTPGGTDANFNELRFEDLMGKEEVYLQGEKDWNILIKNDKGQRVGHDETLTVGNNRMKTIGLNQTEHVGVNHTETIGANKFETVGIEKTETIGAAKFLSVGALYQVSVGAAMNETVIATKTEETFGAKIVMVGAHMSEKVIGTRSIDTGETHTLKAQKLLVEVQDEIIFSTGSASIGMKSNGNIVISGSNIQVKGSGNITINGQKVSTNGR